MLSEPRADLRQLYVDDVAELALGVVGDADLDRVTGAFSLADVLVLFGVKEIAGDIRHFRSAVMRDCSPARFERRARSLLAL